MKYCLVCRSYYDTIRCSPRCESVRQMRVATRECPSIEDVSVGIESFEYSRFLAAFRGPRGPL